MPRKDITPRNPEEDAEEEREKGTGMVERGLREILDSVPELILRFTPDLVTTFANRTYCEYHGVRYEDVVGKSFKDHVHPGDMPSLKEKLRGLTPESPVLAGVERTLMPDGEIRWQEWTDRGIFDPRGNLVEIQSIGRDVTERKRVEEAMAFERESLDALFGYSMEGIVFCDHDLTVLKANPSFCDMFGYTPEEVMGRNIDDLVAGDTDYLEEARGFSTATAGGRSIAVEATRVRKDGSPIQVSCLGVPVCLSDGRKFAYGIYRDITARKAAERAMKESEAKYRELFDSMPVGFYTSTPQGYFLDANPAFIRMLGYGSLEELRSLFIPTDVYASEGERERIDSQDCNEEFVNCIERYRLKRKDGDIIWVEDFARYIKDCSGETLFNQGLCRDITDRLKAEKELKRVNRELYVAATTDNGTGLFNRKYFDEALKKEIDRSSRYRLPLSLAMIDLDNFKALNDTKGHQAGDRALREIALVIRENIRSSDTAARWGGDEFILSTPVGGEQALALARKLRELLLGLDHGGFGPVTCSIGVATCQDGDDIDSLVKRADIALYRVKKRGGDGVSSQNGSACSSTG
ncbi:MAG TPA: sensor domain-containing diguanylate cyclase [Synergistales bacterium]|nr:sensor domain-containing diguanylate cyclase [Synergistales bacterium]